MRRREFSTFFLIALSICSVASARIAKPWQTPPPAQYLDKMEKELGAVQCVGDVRRWERRYEYHRSRTGTVYHLDTAVIDFQLREAGKFGFRSGREFVDTIEPEIDDRPYKIAFGNYDLLRDKLTVETCGPNVG
jgi:hypothetical protein